MYYSFLIIIFARIKHIRLVLHHHSASYTKAYQLQFDWLSRLAGKGALHIALNDLMDEDIRTRYRSVVNVLVAQNACHVPRPAVEDRGDRPFTCGLMSNLRREKGLDTFIACLRTARSAGLNLQALLAGPPASYEAERIIEEAKSEFGDALTVLGPVSGASKHHFFQSIDVFLFPTRYKYEAQPLVLLEAMSYGVPIVATNHGYCTQLIGNAGITAPISEFEAAANAFLTRCHRDINHLREMGGKAHSRYEMLRLEASAQLKKLVHELCEG
ncbi:MAG: glycosyltransferase family 4 protein [Beijerinckiaceae bacterium]|nr:glycosyltransferase family 4 protein [Beijerinckiaceae bacterium]MCI0735428.1 glycosyltransferase family 4 protein [Beijerinckiaceae bacterium]